MEPVNLSLNANIKRTWDMARWYPLSRSILWAIWSASRSLLRATLVRRVGVMSWMASLTAGPKTHTTLNEKKWIHESKQVFSISKVRSTSFKFRITPRTMSYHISVLPFKSKPLTISSWSNIVKRMKLSWHRLLKLEQWNMKILKQNLDFLTSLFHESYCISLYI